MTMHRLFVPPDQLAASARVKLAAEQSRHLVAVLRLQSGAELEVFDGRGGRFRAVLAGDELEIREALPSERRRVDAVVVQALAKGEKMDLVVRKATELGATRVVPLASERAIVRLERVRGEARAERWRRIAQEAARQCGRADVPRVDEPLGWDGLLSLLRAEPDRRALLLDPGEGAVRLGDAARGLSRVLIAVGPEGGFAAEERRRAQENGFLSVAMGPLVLRTETAALAALAVVLHVNGELG
ncbi:MAG: 16S rRNA (uracil(1498)-N(3))-methyltransferase [Deltaproteobacteria bacterium]|nr:MAG: 16S rRNA (uracil(1498)-N(3))-methyltransferase [Deltaproteobacteria bacterium]